MISSFAKALGTAGGMNYKRVQPTAGLIEKVYHKGGELDRNPIKLYEQCHRWLPNLGKCVIRIPSIIAVAMLS